MFRKMAARGEKIFVERKFTKAERKQFKKQARKIFSFRNKENGLQIAEGPTNHLVIGNGGLICGMDRSTLLRLFGRYGNVKSLYMIPGKEFALLSFQTKLEAVAAHKSLHGRPLSYPDEAPKDGITFYLAYLVESLDDRTDLVQWNVRPVTANQKDLHPPGLILVEDFISKEKETELIEYFSIRGGDDRPELNKPMKHRKVKHYGYEFIYGKNNVDKNSPLAEGIPEICKPLICKMIQEALIPWEPDQLTVNQYEVGQGIPPHTDTHSAFEDGIISLSLGSQVVMDFCHLNGKEVSLMLPPRSLLIMKGESRYSWTHGITPRKTDIVIETESKSLEGLEMSHLDSSIDKLTLKERGFRMSLTFRRILKDECRCKYTEKCDAQALVSQENSSKEVVFVPMNDSEAKKLEAAHVNDVYNDIADHFSDTRHSPWPRVADFLRELPLFSIVADAGCGNGKYLGINKDIVTFGSDRSINLIKICRERGYCAIVSDILALPYRSNAFDACISVAVIHHLSTEERRANAIKELLRIVKPNGLVLIYVWAQEQHGDSASHGNVQTASEGGHALPAAPWEAHANECRSGSSLPTTQESSGEKEKERGINDEERKKEARKAIQVNQTRNIFEQQDLLIPWHFRGNQRKKNEGKDGVGPKQPLREEQVFHRFYHVFVEGELEALCLKIKGTSIVKKYNDKGNWCIVLRKL